MDNQKTNISSKNDQLKERNQTLENKINFLHLFQLENRETCNYSINLELFQYVHRKDITQFNDQLTIEEWMDYL